MRRADRGRAMLAALGGAALVVLGAAPAAAQSTPSFFPERYVACHPRQTVAREAPGEAETASSWVPLRRSPAPGRARIAPLTLIDVAVAEPVPARPADAEPSPPHPVVVVANAPQDWRCVGFTRGKSGILRVLEAPPLARFAGHPDAEAWRLDNARAASAAAFTEAVPALRRLLARPVASSEEPALFDALDAKLNAARALGDLGDRASAAPFAEHLAARQDASYSIIWNDGWPALDALDPAVAEAYAARVVADVVRGRAPVDPQAASDDGLLRAALPHLRTRDAARLALVRSLPASDARCDVLAARLRLGDDALERELRPELAVDLRTQRGAACYAQLMPDLFPGRGPDEVDTLLHRHRLEAILDLIERSRAAPTGDPTWRKARGTLRNVLGERSGDPDVAGGRSDSRYSPIKRALFLVALAELGDAKARADAERLVVDPDDEGVAPWLAATLALRFRWPGSEGLAAERLAWARRHSTQRYDTDLDPLRGFLRPNDHVAVVDALAARRDPRFALGLLDRDRTVREATALHVARLRDPAVCSVVGQAAAEAEPQAVDDALWTLSMLGDACREEAHRLLVDDREPAHVRGMALELLAMMRDARVRSRLEPRGARDDLRAARERARIIFEATE